jgi:hypothetical protein
MSWMLPLAAVLLLGDAASSASRAPLQDGFALNIGINCRWEQQCIRAQHFGMRAAVQYVERSDPPRWRIHQCKRNAWRYGNRLDWIGFNNCVRNAALRPQPPATKRHKRGGRHTTR